MQEKMLSPSVLLKHRTVMVKTGDSKLIKMAKDWGQFYSKREQMGESWEIATCSSNTGWEIKPV